MSKVPSKLFEREVSTGRKRPQQQRSEQTVQRIKQAMLDLIAQEGYAAASTNRIAQRARVNIASLYQYFPNRQAIALAMYEDAASELAQIVHQRLLTTVSMPLEKSIRDLIGYLVDFMDQEQMALLRLIEEVPELRDSARALSLENLAYHSSRVYLAQHLGPMSEEQMTCKLFFVQHFGMGLIRQFVLARPTGISKARFLAEITELVVSYLHKPAPDGF